MAVLPVAKHVDDDVFAEALAELDREARRLDDGVRIFAVHVEDGDLEHPGDVGAVARRARVGGVGREADLVIYDEVDGATRGVAFEPREVERLGDDALAHERRVAVDEERHDVEALPAILFRADAAFDDRIHEFEMARVEREGEVDHVTRRGRPVHRLAEVILHVAAAEVPLRVPVAERGEDLADVLVEDVREDVQAAAVGHADDDLFASALRGVLDQEIEHRDHALRAFGREPLRADEVLVHELLEDLGVGQVLQDANALGVVERRLVPRRLHRVLEPVARFGIFDVRVFDADRAAVRLAEMADDVPQRGARRHAADAAGRDLEVVIGLGQVEVPELELGRGLGRLTERIDAREEVAADAVRVDELLHAARHDRGAVVGDDGHADPTRRRRAVGVSHRSCRRFARMRRFVFVWPLVFRCACACACAAGAGTPPSSEAK